MIVFAVAPTGSMERCPDGRKTGKVTISVRPKQTFRKRRENVEQTDKREAAERTADK
jgi:hypothetical protein